MLVQDHMESDLLTVTPTDTCERALALMNAAGVDALPVVEGERLVGLVSEVGIRRRAPGLVTATDGHLDVEAVLPYVRIGGVMTIAPATIAPGAPLAEAVSRMSHDGTAILPVVDGKDHLVGILSFRSLLDLLAGLLPRPSAGNGRVAGVHR